MRDDFSRRLRFSLERWVQGGILHQLLLMVALVASVAVLGGLAAWALTPNFANAGTAIWWAFLRLTDPGYLGDDEGTALRVISTVVTVLGYVLFMGSMIAILTQWLALSIRKLESGLTPIAMRSHVVILGWTNRTPETIKKLLGARGRLQRFLVAQGVRTLRVVVLADEVDAEKRLDLRSGLEEVWNEGQVYLRSGSSLNQDHLERLDLLRAASILIPGADFELGGAELTDARVMKTLLTLASLFRGTPPARRPWVVAEIFDPQKAELARATLGSRCEIIASDRLVSRLVSQSLRNPGAAPVLLQLLSHREGNAIYLRSFPELAGRTPRSLIATFPKAVVLGLVKRVDHREVVHFDPSADVALEPQDLLVLLGQTYADCRPDPKVLEPATATPGGTRPPPAETPQEQRLLILGWGYKVRALLAELEESHTTCFHVTLLSRVPVAERDEFLRPLGLPTARVTVEQVEGDYSFEHGLRSVEPARFDQILFLASSWMDSSEEADARTILGYLLLKSLLPAVEPRPRVLVELLDPDNARILEGGDETVMVSPRILSHLLAHVGLRPELNAVFDALICTGGTEIEPRRVRELDLMPEGLTFAATQARAAELGCVAIGFLIARQDGPPTVHLNPERQRAWNLGTDDRVLLLNHEDDAPDAP